MSKFKDRVIESVRSIPKGKVASYGQIAAIVGVPRAALQVGWVLHESGEDGETPWWRVINRRGFISTKCEEHNKNVQKELLERDGVVVDRNLKVDMKLFRWNSEGSETEKFNVEDYEYRKLGI